MAKQKYLLPILALTVANILWGMNAVLIKMGLESIPVPIFMSIRFLTASLVLLPFAIRTWKPLKRRDFLLLVLCSILYISFSALALNIGLSKTNSINAAIISMLGPLLLFILSAQFLKERLSLKTFIGIMVAFAGSLVIIGQPWETSLGGLTGNLFILISVLCGVIGTILFKPLIKKTSTYQATFMSLFFGIWPITAYGLTQLRTWDIQTTTLRSLTGLIFSTIAIIAANFLFFYALNRKKVHSTGSYTYIQSTATIITAWLILAEQPSPKFVFGAALVFIGVYLTELHTARHPRYHLLHHRKD